MSMPNKKNLPRVLAVAPFLTFAMSLGLVFTLRSTAAATSESQAANNTKSEASKSDSAKPSIETSAELNEQIAQLCLKNSQVLAQSAPKDLTSVNLHSPKSVASSMNWKELCSEAKVLSACRSSEQTPIYHFEKSANKTSKSPQKILVFSLIHGDEPESGSVTFSWIERLNRIDTRNNWRVIPVLNPDGWKLKTRTNAHGVDVNRNFPSKDWNDLAQTYWKTKAQQNARRFPGEKSASEPETLCAMNHIEDFKPDFIISIHTPLGVLDFDGPRVPSPTLSPLPWVALGNFPGSLGRYMWMDRKVPVLTVELSQKMNASKKLEDFDRIQDLSGTVALQAEKLLNKNSKSISQARGENALPENSSVKN